MSAPMILALLDGRKTQTRRIVKPQPPDCYHKLCGPEHYSPIVVGSDGEERDGPQALGVYSDDGEWGVKCPYEVGMRLWIKTGYETRYDPLFDQTYWKLPVTGQFVVTRGRAISKTGRPKRDGGHPGMFMPRWLSQEFKLPEPEITDIRVQRVQEITRLDIASEGWPRDDRQEEQVAIAAALADDENIDDASIEWYAKLWDSINTKPGTQWDANPWVWAITFKRLEDR